MMREITYGVCRIFDARDPSRDILLAERHDEREAAEIAVGYASGGEDVAVHIDFTVRYALRTTVRKTESVKDVTKRLRAICRKRGFNHDPGGYGGRFEVDDHQEKT